MPLSPRLIGNNLSKNSRHTQLILALVFLNNCLFSFSLFMNANLSAFYLAAHDQSCQQKNPFVCEKYNVTSVEKDPGKPGTEGYPCGNESFAFRNKVIIINDHRLLCWSRKKKDLFSMLSSSSGNFLILEDMFLHDIPRVDTGGSTLSFNGYSVCVVFPVLPTDECQLCNVQTRQWRLPVFEGIPGDYIRSGGTRYSMTF